MNAVLLAFLASLRACLRSRTALQLEVLALRHQLALYQRRRVQARARIKAADRLLWAWLSRTWAGWRQVLVFVQPSTVIAWQRRRFRDHWARLSQPRAGRPAGGEGSPGPHWQDVDGEPGLGLSAHRRGTRQARH